METGFRFLTFPGGEHGREKTDMNELRRVFHAKTVWAIILKITRKGKLVRAIELQNPFVLPQFFPM